MAAAIFLRPSKGADAAAPVPPSAVAEPSKPSHATNTAAVVRALHPSYCRAGAARWAWDTCHDEERRGIDAMLTCARKAYATTKAEAAKVAAVPPTAAPANECGKQVEAALRRVVGAQATALETEIAWMTKNREKLASVLQGKTFSEGCRGKVCDDKPMVLDDVILDLEKLGCTAQQFSCDGDLANRCMLSKVAMRLGAGCDAPSGTPGFLVDTATGSRIR